MVVLDAYMAVVVLGIGLWVIGYAIDRSDLCLVGGIVVLAMSGIALVGDGVVVQTGINQSGNTTVGIYEPLIQGSEFSVELIGIFVGLVLMIIGTEEATE